MIKLSRFFEIPFDDPDISLDELIAFGTDNLDRIVANNPGSKKRRRKNSPAGMC